MTTTSVSDAEDRKRGGFVKIDREAWRTLDHLSDGPRLLLMDLIIAADWKTGEVRGSLRSLAEFLQIPVQTFHDRLSVLKKAREVEWGRGRNRVIRYGELTGTNVRPAGQTTDDDVRSAGQGVRSAGHSPGKTQGEERRSSTYDGPKASDDGRGLTSAPATSGEKVGSEGKAQASSTHRSTDPSTASWGENLSVPESWADTGSWGRTLARHLTDLGADQDEAEGIGERLRPGFDDGRLKPSRSVVEDELERVREEWAARDAEIRRARARYERERLQETFGRDLTEALLGAGVKIGWVVKENPLRRVPDIDTMRPDLVEIVREGEDRHGEPLLKTYSRVLSTAYCEECLTPQPVFGGHYSTCSGCSETQQAMSWDERSTRKVERGKAIAALIERTILGGRFLALGDPLPDEPADIAAAMDPEQTPQPEEVKG